MAGAGEDKAADNEEEAQQARDEQLTNEIVEVFQSPTDNVLGDFDKAYGRGAARRVLHTIEQLQDETGAKPTDDDLADLLQNPAAGTDKEFDGRYGRGAAMAHINKFEELKQWLQDRAAMGDRKPKPADYASGRQLLTKERVDDTDGAGGDREGD